MVPEYLGGHLGGIYSRECISPPRVALGLVVRLVSLGCVLGIRDRTQENRIVGVSWRPHETYETYGEEGNKRLPLYDFRILRTFLGELDSRY